MKLSHSYVQQLVSQALQEDAPFGDITSSAIALQRTVVAEAILKDETATICGMEFAQEAFRQVYADIRFTARIGDGQQVHRGDVLFDVEGPEMYVLQAERIALNFVQFLSGTATQTAQYVAVLAGSRTRLLDTRKTIPLFRWAQKYAVTCGGGWNHRFSLSDLVMLKDNHIAAAGSIEKAVDAVRQCTSNHRIEVEVTTHSQAETAMKQNVDRIMLDNMSYDEMRDVIALRDRQFSHIEIEISGNVTLDTLPQLAQLQADFISTGAITKNIFAIDISMKLKNS